MKRSGHADLPLHYGRVPTWLAERMSKLGRAITEAIVIEYGKAEAVKRLSDPLWFQSFGAVLGMDWHSSGITTSVMGALKKSINPISKELGIYIAGGRGKHSRKTPSELLQIASKTGLNGNHLVKCSRLSAKVDNTAIQDGFQIYLHSFILTDDGDWTVVQQGMNNRNGYARRYHWHSNAFESFVNEPHTSVIGQNQGLILNLTDEEAQDTRAKIVDISTEHPDKALAEIRKIFMPAHHDVRMKDVDMKRLGTVIALAYEEELRNFEELLLVKGLGPRTLQSLTLVSEVIHGTPSRFKDPARFSFAHGGKDGHPFPVPTKVYDETIDFLSKAVSKAKIGFSDKHKALKSLHQTAKRLEEGFSPTEDLDKLIQKERKDSNKFGGRTVFDGKDKRKHKPKDNQLKLF